MRNPPLREPLGYLRLGIIYATAAAFVLAAGLSFGQTAEGRNVDSGRIGTVELTAPIQFAPASQSGSETAFREDEAGFSAYYRVAEPDGADGQSDSLPRLNVAAVTRLLRLAPPDDSNAVRSGAGVEIDSGNNFGIIKIPMFAAVGLSVTPRNVTVYYDDQGWIVAYLAKGEPAAGIWRHNSAEGETYNDPKPNTHLEQNLLVLAIKEAVAASGESDSEVTPERVGYYDWQNLECDAFVLFSHKSNGGESTPVTFVIPPKIGIVKASAAVLITSHPEDGEDTTAQLLVDDEPATEADVANRLATNNFAIARDDETSVHRMRVGVDADKTAAGVIMLVYDKP